MPQIFVMAAPRLRSSMTEALRQALDQELSRIVVEMWPEVPADDVAFSMVTLDHVRKEADLQIEVRYTAGTDEYSQGAVFDPSPERQAVLAAELQKAAKRLTKYTVSVWTKPFYGGIFLPPR